MNNQDKQKYYTPKFVMVCQNKEDVITTSLKDEFETPEF